MWIRAYASVYQNMFQLVDEKCLDDNMEAMADQVDVIFTATRKDCVPLWSMRMY